MALAVTAWMWQFGGDRWRWQLCSGSDSFAMLAAWRWRQYGNGGGGSGGWGQGQRAAMAEAAVAVAAVWQRWRKRCRTMTKTTMIMTMMVALPMMIELIWATVLMPHLAQHGFDVVVFVTVLSCNVHKRANALAFECHRHANVRAFVLGPGWRDNGADGGVVHNSGAHGDVHRGRHGTDEAEGDADADNTIW